MTKRADQNFLVHVNQEKWQDALDLFDVGNVDPNAVNKHGSTALHLASRQPSVGRQAFLKAMLNRGADPGRFDERGRLPSHVALDQADWGGWTFWTEQDPSFVNRTTREGHSPYWVGRNGNEGRGFPVHPFSEQPFLSWMLDHGLDVTHVEPGGQGLLLEACGNPALTSNRPNEALIDRLLNQGAPVATLAKENRRSPLTQAMMHGHEALTRRFLDVGERQAAETGGDPHRWREVLVQALLTTLYPVPGTPSNPRYRGPQDLVFEHIERYHPGLLNAPLLPRQGFPDERYTLLHALVASQGAPSHLEVMIRLKDHGVDLFALDSSGRTAAEVALRDDDREWLVLHESLRDAPAEPRVRARM